VNFAKFPFWGSRYDFCHDFIHDSACFLKQKPKTVSLISKRKSHGMQMLSPEKVPNKSN